RDGDRGTPVLVLGPLLRYVGETAATIWVETDRACQVEILGHRVRTFEVAGHHYGLVVVGGLRPGAEYEYQVALDGTVCWPEPGSPFPPSLLRTLAPDRPPRLVFGSCRIAELPVPRRRRGRARPEHEYGADALCAWALDLPETPRERWPDVMLLIGDQVYADEVGPATRQFIRERRDPSRPPGYEIADFTEYCFLYREAWSEPSVRWLLSVVPTAMIFDDHDVHDDWNISSAWRREYQAKPWWRARIGGAYMSYWVYQHLGNLSPEELGRCELWRQVQEPGDAAAVLSDFALRAGQGSEGIQWSFRRSFGRVRAVVIDSRSGRVLEDGNRLMVNEAEWQWVTESVTGDWDHVVLATSLPLLLPRGIHAVEAWSEAVCDGAWGKHFARTGERVRRAVDLEHWAAFGKSFAKFERLLTGLATGVHGQPPASITVISGDIHHSYLAAVEFPAGTESRSAVYQAVCSPVHNMMPRSLRRGQQLATSRVGEMIGTTLARLAGVAKPEIRWRITRGPWFYNMLSALEFDGRKARIRLERTAPDESVTPRLQPVCETELS
ncbi:MAG TPA: alkaline phosphatase D family protein, partial [Streptosporangiaceae bacterium]|nr:alkaline phosphatase D family protein [Streptosporangiaceae bacterium]